MSFFDDNDDFENIVREFFGSPGGRRRRLSEDEIISGENEERNVDFVEGKDKFFVIFELPGYNKEDVGLDVKGNKLTINIQKKLKENIEPYLSKKLSQGMQITKMIPSQIKTKKYDFTFSNGVLEVGFRR